MLTTRQSKILNTIIDEYIQTAQPVSSGVVFDVGTFEVSCPTIRNEMAELTELGYLAQPHTSAGRVPTERGYRFFVDEILSEMRVRARKSAERSKKDIKKIAQDFSLRSQDIALFTDDEGDLKYVGLREAFLKPEFREAEAIVSLIGELERMEERISSVFESLDNEIEVFIGSENPLFKDIECGMMISRLDDGFISLLGPMRMNYKNNLQLFNEL